MRWVVIVLLVACGSKSEEPPKPTPRPTPSEVAPAPAPAPDNGTWPQPQPTPMPAPTAPSQGRVVRWSEVKRTDGCFFFSGPEGRDDQLVGDVVVETVERNGSSIRVKIGTATFDGTLADGELSLARKSQYDFNGPWKTTETIRGKLHDGGIRARYAYEECEVANKKECPGRCTVTGTMWFVRGL